MPEKPTYEALEKRIKRLEQTEKALIASEQKWRDILVNIPQIGIALDPQARIIFANDHFLKLTGWKANEVIDQDWFDLFIPVNVREAVRNVFSTVMSQQDTLGFSTYENQIVTRCSGLRDVAWSNVLTKDAQGNILDVTCLGIDLTERNQLEATLNASERFLSTIFDSIQDGISVLDAQLNVVRVNQTMRDLYAHEQPLEGKKCYEAYHGRSKPCSVCPTIRSLSSGKLEMSEVPLKVQEREMGILELFAFPMLDDSGNSIGAVEFVRNVTDRKRAESALRESEERFRALVEKSPLGISLIADDGAYKYINPQFTNIFGYTLEDIPTGNAWFKKSFPDKAYRQKAITKWVEDKKQINVGQARPRVFTVTCKDGEQKKIHFRPVTMENHDQFVSYEDITEKSMLEQQLLQAQKFEAIGTLAGGIAHNFNNILMGIQGRTSLMSLELMPSHPNLEHIKSIDACIQSATGLTKQLLGFARGGKYEVKAININALVLNSATMFSRTRKEINVHTKMPQAQLLVDADRGQIEQVLLNLYINAWQAMPGGGELYLETSAVSLDDNDCKPFDAKPGRYANVSITDTGIGMDENTCRRIFDPFFTTKEKRRGTGLGLASAYGIIKNHGGIITVNSKRNHGTTFNIYLKISEKEIHPEIATAEAVVKGSGTILLVDDEEMIINVSQALLEKLGYQVIAAKSGEEATEVVLRMGSGIDLVILDVIMPGMDGIITFDRIRAIHPQMPVLLSSGYAVDGQSVEILQRGCNGFIQKPFDISKLSLKIQNIMEAATAGNQR
ncbi:PAS domain S-box protein [Desulfosarcina sp.]|uniref:PAS domain-containing hybrid sensor histidine kinase/response regulator n=1 Tax=Desulfosarcina sp. TaxID=2027861 RepID=UPI003970AD3D